MKYLKSIALASLLAITASANAELYSFNVNPATGGSLGSNAIHDITSTFDSDNEVFTWNTTLAPVPAIPGADEVDGFWLVVNNGPNPKSSDVNELAIMYGDLKTGILSTYVYNGQNSATSINSPAILLQTDSFTTVTDGFNLSISTANINAYDPNDVNADYTGIAFDEKIGIWFHFSSGSDFTYNANGDIVDFVAGKTGWYDTANQNAIIIPPTSVSAPSVFALFGLAIAGLTFMRKKAK